MKVSLALGLVYVVTKFGYLYMCDFETAMPLCCCTICPDIVFSTALNQETQGIVAISRNGQVKTGCFSLEVINYTEVKMSGNLLPLGTFCGFKTRAFDQVCGRSGEKASHC